MDNYPIVDEILGFLTGGLQLLPRPFEDPYSWLRRLRRLDRKEYYDAIYRLKKRRLIKVYNKDGRRFIALTKEGVLETLLLKAGIKKQKKWDGKWRVCVFDIPEDAHLERDRLRWLLKRYGFQKLQASVFINPYPLNREAIAYLEESGLHKYIRFMKVEELDNDKDLKQKFELS